MPLVDAAKLVRHAAKNKYAVVQINTNGGTYDITRAIIETAEEENAPVILGAYEAVYRWAKENGRQQFFQQLLVSTGLITQPSTGFESPHRRWSRHPRRRREPVSDSGRTRRPASTDRHAPVIPGARVTAAR